MIAYRHNPGDARALPIAPRLPLPYRHRIDAVQQTERNTDGRDALLRTVERTMDRFGYSASAFGRDAAGDPRLVFDLRVGRKLGDRTRTKVRAFILRLEEGA